MKPAAFLMTHTFLKKGGAKKCTNEHLLQMLVSPEMTVLHDLTH
jgi:hypothetical protein